MHYHGRGISRDYKAAIKLFKLTADQGHVVAQYNLGRAYALGQDVIDDLTRAYMWWHIAASKGNEEAIQGRNIIEEPMPLTGSKSP